MRGKGINYTIKLERDNSGREKEVPWGPLYSILRDELLILRKTLIDLLDKGFIRVSNSLVVAPVLFIKKARGGL
jgi:hypothetical protein